MASLLLGFSKSVRKSLSLLSPKKLFSPFTIYQCLLIFDYRVHFFAFIFVLFVAIVFSLYLSLFFLFTHFLFSVLISRRIFAFFFNSGSSLSLNVKMTVHLTSIVLAIFK